jgi:hypothetical protein
MPGQKITNSATNIPTVSQPADGMVTVVLPNGQKLDLPLPAATEARDRYFINDKLLEHLFRYGFASIFLINFVNGIIEPASFTDLLEKNIFVPSFTPTELMVKLASFNDLFVGLLVLSGWRKRWVLAWGGSWFLIVALTKIGHFLA